MNRNYSKYYYNNKHSNRQGLKDLSLFDSFINKCMSLFSFVDPAAKLYQATGCYSKYIISNKSCRPDLVIYNKTFNKNLCFYDYVSTYRNDYNKFPRVKFDLPSNPKGSYRNIHKHFDKVIMREVEYPADKEEDKNEINDNIIKDLNNDQEQIDPIEKDLNNNINNNITNTNVLTEDKQLTNTNIFLKHIQEIDNHLDSNEITHVDNIIINNDNTISDNINNDTNTNIELNGNNNIDNTNNINEDNNKNIKEEPIKTEEKLNPTINENTNKIIDDNNIKLEEIKTDNIEEISNPKETEKEEEKEASDNKKEKQIPQNNKSSKYDMPSYMYTSLNQMMSQNGRMAYPFGMPMMTPMNMNMQNIPMMGFNTENDDIDDNDPLYNNFNEDYSKYNASIYLEKPVLIVKKNLIVSNWFLMKDNKILGNYNSEQLLYFLGEELKKGNKFENVTITDYHTDVFFNPSNLFEILRSSVPKLKKRYIYANQMTYYYLNNFNKTFMPPAMLNYSLMQNMQNIQNMGNKKNNNNNNKL